MARIFGFDIGTTSIGFAVVDHEPARERGEILRLGVRIFPEARDPDGMPLNQTRRQKRMMRRQLRRRRERRRALNEALFAAGLLPAYGTDGWREVMKVEPVALRVRGLFEPLDPCELGRALYHLAKRRHFKGRDLPEGEDAEALEDKETRASRDSTLEHLKDTGQTLGQFLATKGPRERQRGIHSNRSFVSVEFDRLWDAQAAHHAVLRDPGFRARIEDVVFGQRPVFWRKSTLRKCRFMPEEALCPKGSWLSQQRRMLEKLNNLALVGDHARPLDEEERSAILEKLQVQSSMGWPSARSALKQIFKSRGEAGRERPLRFNLEEGGDPKLLGNAVEAKLADIFGKSWADHPRRQAVRDGVPQRLWAADYGEIGDQRVVIRSESERNRRRADAERSFVADFGVTAHEAAALREMRLPTGWEPFSTAALHQFMPHLEAGVRFGALINGPEWEDWRAHAFPNREQPTGIILDRLPSPACKDEQRRISALRNPTVIRCQNELRKVVNNLIGLYGKPDLIRVELARQVGKSKREREDMQAGLRRQEKRRREAAADLRSKGIDEPSPADIEKWLLWKECGEFDPYSGRPICFDDLFRTNEFDAEHIWPRWISFDNSFANKTLCLKAFNVTKANRTPFEAFGSDPEWTQMKERVWKLVKDGKMKQGKAKRFCREEPLDDDFKSRQLNDTGFAARQAVVFLKRLWPDAGIEAPVTVQAVTGRVTAQIRRIWGLNNILSDEGEKTRADHRHHTIDALVVACTNPGMMQKLSNYWQAEEDPKIPRPRLDPPWSTIRADAEQAVSATVVSHRVRKKVSGPLHAEMPLGYTGRDVVKNSITYGVFIKRMPVEKLPLQTLKISTVEEISTTAKFVVRDDSVRSVLRAHLESAGVPSTKAYPPYPRVSGDGPEIRKVRILTLRQKKLMVPVTNGFADPANNHHVAIYRLPNGNIDFEVVSLFETSRRLARGESVVRRKRDDGAVFIMSLSAGDTIQFAKGQDQPSTLWRVQKIASKGQISLLDTHDASPEEPTLFEPMVGGIMSRDAVKISVDPIGRVRPAND
jgi:CRISPR-associated endonuclease Csn1